MKPYEARVFIIDDSASKVEGLTSFIEQTGGKVVGTVDNKAAGKATVTSPDFPSSFGNPNIVLLDGNLDGCGRHGEDGEAIFRRGYEVGNLHRVDSEDSLGAVALGCSADFTSDVAFVTGGNIDRLYRDDAAERWASFLEPHPVDPKSIEQGVIERAVFPGVKLTGMIICLGLGDKATIAMHSVEETKNRDEREEFTYSREVTEPITVDLNEFSTEAGEWQDKNPNGTLNVDSHIVKLLIRTDGCLYVIRHDSRVVAGRMGSEISKLGTVDKIAIERLDEIPDSYWEYIGIVRPNYK